MMKKFIELFLVLLILLGVTGCNSCQKGDVKMENSDDIISKQNNILLKDDLITKTVDIESSGSDLLDLKMAQVNNIYEIECIRKIDKGYYCIFEDRKGGILYLLFSMKEDDYFVTDYWHYINSISKSDYDKLILGSSTIKDVRKIDPYGYEMLDLSTGRLPYSNHQTVDGYLVTITYVDGNIVSTIEYSKRDDLLSNLILPIDR